MKSDDYFLIQRIHRGDAAALETLVRKHYDHVFYFCFRRIGDEEGAADLTQDIFLKLTRSIGGYRPTGSFTAYLYTIARNVCRDYLKKKRLYISESQVEEIAGSELPEELLLGGEAQQTLHTYLGTLPDVQKEALILYYFHDCSLKEVAQIVDAPISTVKSRIFQGIKKLRKYYEEEDDEDVSR